MGAQTLRPEFARPWSISSRPGRGTPRDRACPPFTHRQMSEGGTLGGYPFGLLPDWAALVETIEAVFPRALTCQPNGAACRRWRQAASLR